MNSLDAWADQLAANDTTYINVGHAIDGGASPVSPPEWREMADATCEPCDGTGHHPHHRVEWHDITCTTCHGTGRKVHTITAKKPGWLYDSRKGTHVWRDDRTVSVDVTVRLVPVVDEVPEGYSGIECIEVNPANGYCRWWPAWDGALEYDDGRDITPLGDPLTPGDWVAIIRKVNS